MKFLKVDGDHLVFHLGKREKNLLLEVLRLYPLIPVSHLQIGKPEEMIELRANQQLLEDALAEHRAENKRALDAMLAEPERFQETSSGYRMALTQAQVEWLLQVLNDIRVGSWLHLGSPDEKQGRHLSLSVKNARYLWAMELCGQFQFALLSGQQSD